MPRFALVLALATAASAADICFCMPPMAPTPPLPPIPPMAPIPPPPPGICTSSCLKGISVFTDACTVGTGCIPGTQTSDKWSYNATGNADAFTISIYGGSANCSGTPYVSKKALTKTCAADGWKIGGSCFPGGAKVTLKDGSKKTVEKVVVGDEVLTAFGDRSLGYDRVFRISHAQAGSNDFLRLSTAAGPALTLTPGHMLHVGDIALDSLKLASDVKVGDVVFVADAAAGRARPTEVTKIETVTLNEGSFNFHTTGGTVVVDGVVGSHFTIESTWANKKMAVMWYKLLDVLPEAIRKVIDGPIDVRRA